VRPGPEVGLLESADFRPIDVSDFHLDGTEAPPEPQPGRHLSVLVWLHGMPLGQIMMTAPTGRGELATQVLGELPETLAEHLAADGIDLAEFGAALLGGADVPGRDECKVAAPEVALAVPATVVVCTLGRNPLLRDTLESLLAQDYPDLEVVVVDNDPESGRAAAVVADVAARAASTGTRIRLVAEPRRGLSWARNAGIAAAQGAIVAFTDDDCRADRHWISRVAAVFEVAPDVACVTGLVLPAELSTPFHVWFEEFGTFCKGYRPVRWDLAGAGGVVPAGEMHPYSGGYGSGNNMAFRAEVLATGGFDVALGAGTPSRGGEDLDMFVTLVLTGHVIAYEPSALIRHHHRATYLDLHAQVRGYGSGLAAMLTKQILNRPRDFARTARRIPAGLRYVVDPGSGKNNAKSKDFPLRLTLVELFGMLEGPLLYLRGRPFRAARILRREAAWAPAADAVPAGGPEPGRPGDRCAS
jgi:glycosyltransferase involved in cell wall biosynthesis